MTSHTAAQALTLDELMALRERTERLSSFLSGRLRSHLDTIYPLLAPGRVFGTYLGSKQSVPREEEAYTLLAERFREVSGAPFDLRSDLDDQTLSGMEYGIEIYPWEYPHHIGGRTITITSPVRWILTYRSEYTPAQVRDLPAVKTDRRPQPLRQFLANALATHIVLSRVVGLAGLLQDLRYQVGTELAPGLGELSVVTIGCPISSFRPPDDLITTATRFSGVPAFKELVRSNAAGDLTDELRVKVESILT